MAIKGREAPMAAIGSYDSVLPFQAIGIETVVIGAENRGTVPQLISRFSRDEYAILFMEESLFVEYREDAEAINESESISIIPIPNQAGSMGTGVQSIRKNTERAVGMDIFKVQ